MAADRTRARAEADAAAVLYGRHYDRIFGYCLYNLRSREEAEDAAQTTFLHAVRALRRGVAPVAEVSWLLTIARNVCFAGFRTRARRGRVEVLSDPEALADAAALPDAAASRVELEQALARIPEQQRRAIVLREWRGLSYREIAADLGVSVAAVETMIFRARRSLAEILADERPQRRRGLSAVFDLGGLVAALKSALGGASAAKVAAGAAVVAVALVAGPATAPPPERELPRGDVLAGSVRPAAERPALGQPPRAPDRPTARFPRAQGAPRSAPPRERGAEEREKPGPSPAPSVAPAEPGAQPGSGTVETVVGTATGTVGTLVEETAATVDEVVATTGIPLPGVGAAADDLTDEAVELVDGASPLLP